MKKKIMALLLAVGIVGSSIGTSAAEFGEFTDGEAAYESEVIFESSEEDESATLSETEEFVEILDEEIDEASAGGRAIKIEETYITDSFDRKAVDYDWNMDEYDYCEARIFLPITNTGTKTVKLNLSELKYYYGYGTQCTLKPGETVTLKLYARYWGLFAGKYEDVLKITDSTGEIDETVTFVVTVAGPRDMFDLNETELKLKSKYDGAAGRRMKFTVTNTSKETYKPIAFSESKKSAFAISGFSKEELKPGESGTFTILGRTNFKPGTYEEQIKICTSKDQKDYKLLKASIRVYPKIVKIQPIESRKFENGFQISQPYLPEAKLELSDGTTERATVEWDIANCGYNPKETKPQKLTIRGTIIRPSKVGNTDDLSLEVECKVLVREYRKPDTPEIKEVFVWGDSVTAYLKERVRNAEAGRLFIGTIPDFIEKRQFAYSFTENAIGGVYDVNANRVAPGHYYCAMRTINKEAGKNVYSDWSNVMEFDVEAKRPATPAIKSVVISGNDVKVSVGNITGNTLYRCMLSTDPNPDSADKNAVTYTTGKRTRKTKVVNFDGIAKGTYYIHIDCWNEERVSAGVKSWYSDRPTPKKVIVTGDGPKETPVKTEVVAKKYVRVRMPVVEGADGYEIRIGTGGWSLMYYDEDSRYVPKTTVMTKTGAFKDEDTKAVVNIKDIPRPGDYFIVYRQYKVENGQKYYSKWYRDDDCSIKLER